MIPITNNQYKDLFRKWLYEHLDGYLYLDLLSILCLEGDLSEGIVSKEDGLYFIDNDTDATDPSKQEFFAYYSETEKIDEFLEKDGTYDFVKDYFGPSRKIMTFTEYVENYFELDD